MKKETRVAVLVLAAVIVLCAAVSGWVILTADSTEPLVTPVPPPESSKPEFDINDYEIKGNVPDVVKPLEEDKTTSVTITDDGAGNQTVVNDWSKPAEPEKPTVEDESQLTDPTKEPEYAPPAEPKDTTPKGGEKNSSGQVYLPGFGWVTPSQGEGQTIDNSGWQDSPQVGMM